MSVWCISNSNVLISLWRGNYNSNSYLFFSSKRDYRKGPVCIVSKLVCYQCVFLCHFEMMPYLCMFCTSSILFRYVLKHILYDQFQSRTILVNQDYVCHIDICLILWRISCYLHCHSCRTVRVRCIDLPPLSLSAFH